MVRKEIVGKYFPYCQLCTHDGNCVLRHNEYLGTAAGSGVDQTGYTSHEDFSWGFSAFQKDVPREHCTGKIRQTESQFLPLQCECGTAVSSVAISAHVCAKLSPHERGQRWIDEQKGSEALPYREIPWPDEEYQAVMVN